MTDFEALPAMAGQVARAHPALYRAYAAMGEACAQAGPIEGETLRLVKLALAVGAGSEVGCIRIAARRSRRAWRRRR